MPATTFLEEAREISRPWYVESTELDRERSALSVYLNFERGGTFACGTCGQPNSKAYDTSWKCWRHMDFFGHQTFLHAPSPRVNCPVCGVRQARLPWARARSRFTRGMEDRVVELADELSVRAVARVLGEHDTRLGRLIRRNHR